MIANADEITQLAFTPTSCAMRKSSVEARSWTPSAVRLSSSTMPTSSTIVVIQVAISSRENSTPETSNWFVSHGIGSTVRGSPGGKIM